MQSSRLAVMGAMLAGLPSAMLGTLNHMRLEESTPFKVSGPRRYRGHGPSRHEVATNADYRSPAKLRNSIGKIGLGMHASSYVQHVQHRDGNGNTSAVVTTKLEG